MFLPYDLVRKQRGGEGGLRLVFTYMTLANRHEKSGGKPWGAEKERVLCICKVEWIDSQALSVRNCWTDGRPFA